MMSLSWSGTVFSDTNSNGVKDSGEPGLPGYTINFGGIAGIDPNFTYPHDSQVSDSNGAYTITETDANFCCGTVSIVCDPAYLTTAGSYGVLPGTAATGHLPLAVWPTGRKGLRTVIGSSATP